MHRETDDILSRRLSAVYQQEVLVRHPHATFRRLRSVARVPERYNHPGTGVFPPRNNDVQTLTRAGGPQKTKVNYKIRRDKTPPARLLIMNKEDQAVGIKYQACS